VIFVIYFSHDSLKTGLWHIIFTWIWELADHELVCDNSYRKLWERNKENLTRSIVKLVKLYLREYDTYKIATEQINLDSVKVERNGNHLSFSWKQFEYDNRNMMMTHYSFTTERHLNKIIKQFFGPKLGMGEHLLCHCHKSTKKIRLKILTFFNPTS
jgi:hypothetical protein